MLGIFRGTSDACLGGSEVLMQGRLHGEECVEWMCWQHQCLPAVVVKESEDSDQHCGGRLGVLLRARGGVQGWSTWWWWW